MPDGTTSRVTGDRGPTFEAIIGSFFGAAFLAVLGRFLNRYLSSQKIWLDDIVIAVALLLDIEQIVLGVIYTHQGFGKHVAEVGSEETLQHISYELWVDEIFYTVVLWLVKLSVLLFYWRIFRVQTIRVKALFWGSLSAIITGLIAVPLISALVCHGKLSSECGQVTRPLSNAIPNIVTDFFLILFPIPFIMRLKVSRADRVSLTIIFTLGALVTAISIIRFIFLFTTPHNHDFTWNDVRIMTWTKIEANLAIFVACLPSLAPTPRAIRKAVFRTVRVWEKWKSWKKFRRQDNGASVRNLEKSVSPDIEGSTANNTLTDSLETQVRLIQQSQITDSNDSMTAKPTVKRSLSSLQNEQ